MKKTRVSIVSYLNSKPFLFGLKNSLIADYIELSLDIPSKVAAKLAYNLSDIGLIPVAALEDLDEYSVISNYCIGSVGKVRTVVLASQVPLNEIETILMDYQSRTSVMLAKVLARYYWKKEFIWENTCNDFQYNSIEGTTAGVVIGDRVFEIENRYRYMYDLGDEWLNFTGLPFVFAVWATNKGFTAAFEENFNNALSCGIKSMDEIVKTESARYPLIDVAAYFSDNISFEFDEKKQAGMKKFLELARKLEPVQLS